MYWSLYNTTSVFLDLCIGYILIELDAKYYYNVTSYKSFINKVYDLVGQPSYIKFQSNLVAQFFLFYYQIKLYRFKNILYQMR